MIYNRKGRSRISITKKIINIFLNILKYRQINADGPFKVSKEAFLK